MRRFECVLHIQDGMRIIDIGGGQYNWQFIKKNCQILIINLEKPNDWKSNDGRLSFEQGDGTKLKYEDKSFDIVYSNSVIEHLGTWEKQMAFAGECRRIGKTLWIQTPAKCFPVEPHLITPFIHWLPRGLQSRLMRYFTVWGLITRPDRKYIDGFLRERRLLTHKEMKTLFPDCRIIRERFLFLTKAYIAVRTQ